MLVEIDYSIKKEANAGCMFTVGKLKVNKEVLKLICLNRADLYNDFPFRFSLRVGFMSVF